MNKNKLFNITQLLANNLFKYQNRFKLSNGKKTTHWSLILPVGLNQERVVSQSGNRSSLAH